MTSVVELSARYANFLVHPLPSGPGICAVCRGTTNPPYPTCRPCEQATAVLGAGTADVVVPISLAPKGEQYANELWRYKNTQGLQRQHFRMGLAAVLWRFLDAHEACIAAHCSLPRFDTVTMVPSTAGRIDHPLRAIVAGMIGFTRSRYRDLLTPAPDAAALGRTPSLGRYVSVPLRGESVLLIDDTWTTGHHAQSASSALKAAGAGCVALVVLGRHLNAAYGGTSVHIGRAQLRCFSWDVCALRSDRHS